MIEYLLSKEKITTYFLAFFFASFLTQAPISNLSVNYVFILVPLFIIFKNRHIKTPDIDFQIAFIIYTSIFVVAALIQAEYWPDILRKLGSYLIFMTAFIFTFINVTDRMLVAFKLAVVLYVSYMTMGNVLEFRSFGLTELGAAAKNQVGNQRYGFLYIFAFWIILFFKSQYRLLELAKFPLALFIFLGILLTFSRASIVGLIGSALFFIYVLFGSYIKVTLKSSLVFILFFILIFLALINSSAYEYIELPVEFFLDELFSLRSKDGSMTFDIANPESSEGFRIFLIQTIISYIGSWPLTGSGFMGIWILFEDRVGSAHGQFNDVLFRTGIIGLFVYLFLLYRLGKFLLNNHMGLCMGFIGIIVYGLFHETFKLSHGAFVLAFLFGLYATHKREKINT
jgi:hypothetical protein